MRRLLAARQRDVGLEIVTLPLLAARLAGGFRRPATRQDLNPAIRVALDAGGFGDLERIRTLPGMTRAIGRTLANPTVISRFTRGPQSDSRSNTNSAVSRKTGEDRASSGSDGFAFLNAFGHAYGTGICT
jgi:hypothetical protein